MESKRLGDVFVVGRLPDVTYNPRNGRGLEDDLRAYLEDRGTILSVSGATKTGKTVLIRSVAPNALTLSGGAILSAQDMWDQLAEHLGLWTEETARTTESIGSTTGINGGLNLGLVNTQGNASEQVATNRENAGSRRISSRVAVRNYLSRVQRDIFIDDFHYIDRDVQLEIVRGLKDLVFDGLGVVFASVPHRAFDAVRVEKEMTGRVTHLRVAQWSEDELETIAHLGFEVLNVSDPSGALAKRLAKESFSSPHLMQEFCKRLCRNNGVQETAAPTKFLQSPPDWSSFFMETAVDTSKAAFEILKTGPRQRSDRMVRTLQGGHKTDIYGAVLAAIAHTGPRLEIPYEDLRAALREVLIDEVPQRHEVTRVLDQMTQIAKNKVEGEPVLEYDDEMSRLHISDPYFAFYLRWGETGLQSTAS